MLDRKKAIEDGILFEKKVRLVAVPRAGAMIEDQKHIGYFMYEGTKVRFVLPKSRSRRTLYPLLSAKEEEFFSEALGVDLNLYAKEDNFWHTFEVIIEKNETFMKMGIVFNLEDPFDNLKWRLLKIQPSVAPSWDQRFENGEYRFALVDEDVESSEKVSKVTQKEKAYKFLSKISNSATKMYDFLAIYSLSNVRTKRPSPEASRDTLYTEMAELIEDNIKAFLAIAEDPNYETKLLIHRGIGLGAIEKKIQSRDYFTSEGKFLGNNIDQVVSNLRTPEYQDDYIKLKAVVDSTGK